MIAHLALVAAWLPLSAVDPTSDAFRAGQMVGMILALLAMLAVVIFAIIAIINAFVKRTAGWIVAGCFAGAIIIAVAGLMMTGFVKGFKQGYDNARARIATNPAPAVQPERVTGAVMPFSIEQPAGWKLQRKQAAYDVVLSDKNDFVGVIAEEADLGGAENVAQLAHKQIAAAGSEVTFGDDEAITIDGRKWVAFTAKCKVQNLPFAYQYYVYSGKEGTLQIMGWTFQNLWAREAPALRTVMQTFRFPPATDPAPPAPAEPVK
jgi:hypothetical protein